MNLLNRDRVCFDGEAGISSGMDLFQSLQQNLFLPEREESVKVVNKDKALLRPRDSGNVLHVDRDSARCNEVVTRNFHDPVSCVNHQCNCQDPGPGDDELVSGPDCPCGKPEALSHIHDRNDLTLDIKDTEYNFRCFGEGGDSRCPEDLFNGTEREGVLLLIERKDQQTGWCNYGFLRAKDNSMLIKNYNLYVLTFVIKNILLLHQETEKDPTHATAPAATPQAWAPNPSAPLNYITSPEVMIS